MRAEARGMSKPEGRTRAARLGRRIGLISLVLFVAVPTVVWASQIILAVFAPPSVKTSTDCRTGVLGLANAVQRARNEAAQEPEGERPALARFRQALEPEWRGRTWLSMACGNDPKAMRALTELDALRYAEEHAVRYEAVALAKQRRRAAALEQELAKSH
jgi:hypothetical protein